MGCILSKKIAPEPGEQKITEKDRVVLELKGQRDLFQQNQRKIQQDIAKERQLAESLLQEGKKNEAKLLLRKRKYQEQILERTDSQLKNLKEMVQDAKSACQLAQIEFQVEFLLEHGKEALKEMDEIMSIKDVERIMDETREGIEYQRKIDKLVSESLTQEDEDAVLQELEEMTNFATFH